MTHENDSFGSAAGNSAAIEATESVVDVEVGDDTERELREVGDESGNADVDSRVVVDIDHASVDISDASSDADVDAAHVVVADAAGDAGEADGDAGEADSESAADDGAVSPAASRPRDTGDPRVDDALARLDDLDSTPTADHVVIFDEVHRRLQSALTDREPDASNGN